LFTLVAATAATIARAQCSEPSLCGVSCAALLANLQCNADAGGGDGWTPLAQQYCAYAVEFTASHTPQCDATAAQAAVLLNATCPLGSVACANSSTSAALLTLQLQQCLGAQAPCTGAARLPCNNQRRQPYNSVGVARVRVPNLNYYAMHDEMPSTACDTLLGIYATVYANFGASELAPTDCAGLADLLWNAPFYRYREFFVLYPTLDTDGVVFEQFREEYSIEPSFPYSLPQTAYDGAAPTVLLFENASVAVDRGAAAFDAVLFSHGATSEPIFHVYSAIQWAASGRIAVLAWSADENNVWPRLEMQTDPLAGFYGFMPAVSFELLFAFEQWVRPSLHRQQFEAALAFTDAGGVSLRDVYSGYVAVGGHSLGVSTALLLSGVAGYDCATLTAAQLAAFGAQCTPDPTTLPYCITLYATFDPGFAPAWCAALRTVAGDPAYWDGSVNGVTYAPYTPLFPDGYVAPSDGAVNSSALRMPGLIGGVYEDAVITDHLLYGGAFALPNVPIAPQFYDDLNAQLPSALFTQPQIGYGGNSDLLIMYSLFYAPYAPLTAPTAWPVYVGGGTRFKVFQQYLGYTGHNFLLSKDACAVLALQYNQSTVIDTLEETPVPPLGLRVDPFRGTVIGYYEWFCGQPIATTSPTGLVPPVDLAAQYPYNDPCMCNSQTEQLAEELWTQTTLDFLDAVSPGRQWCADGSRRHLNVTASVNHTTLYQTYCSQGWVAELADQTCCVGSPPTTVSFANWPGLVDATCNYTGVSTQSVPTLGAPAPASYPVLTALDLGALASLPPLP
jgi:hypothetical protein